MGFLPNPMMFWRVQRAFCECSGLLAGVDDVLADAAGILRMQRAFDGRRGRFLDVNVHFIDAAGV